MRIRKVGRGDTGRACLRKWTPIKLPDGGVGARGREGWKSFPDSEKLAQKP